VTGCERVLQLLSDGLEHTHLELYQLGVVAHSRISDLRKRGHVIETWRDGDLYLYRLVSSPLPPRSDSVGGGGGAAAAPEPVVPVGEQMSLVAA
jgi:hypothetical protein